jgi:hypothetical protein
VTRFVQFRHSFKGFEFQGEDGDGLKFQLSFNFDSEVVTEEA